jgi:hypothetical protein
LILVDQQARSNETSRESATGEGGRRVSPSTKTESVTIAISIADATETSVAQMATFWGARNPPGDATQRNATERNTMQRNATQHKTT